MSRTVAQVRQAVAALIEAVAAPIAFKESRWDLVAGVEPQPAAHGAFAVVALSTVFASEAESSRRVRQANEGVVQTAIGVRWLFRVKADSYVTSLDAAYAAEAAAYGAITAASASTGLRLSVLELRREIVGDGTWLRGEIVIRADHLLAI
jgi:hypothetical protein